MKKKKVVKKPVKKIAQKLNKEDAAKIKLAEKINSTFSKKEIRAILTSGKFYDVPQVPKYPKINFKGKTFKFGILTDTHIGSVFFHEEWLKTAFKMFRDEGCKFITHSGDVTEGLSNRPGHVYELTHIGYDQQKAYVIDLFNKYNNTKLPMYMIDGNHDRWYLKSNGALIVKDIVKELSFAKFLGHDSGEFKVNNIIIQLWHGEDGSSYATSYRLQKLVEAITGGFKPNIIIAGHTHKQCYIFERHIHVLSGGACSAQSSFMKSKKLANHAGFYIANVTTNSRGVARFGVEWFPFYG